MEDTEFFDYLHQGWSKTTAAKDSYWSVNEVELDADSDYTRTFDVVAVTSDTELHVGTFRSEEDAGFVAAIHGCLPDLLRKLGDLEDENSRLDEKADKYIGWLANALCEIEDLREKRYTANELNYAEVEALKREIESLEDELASAYGDAE